MRDLRTDRRRIWRMSLQAGTPSRCGPLNSRTTNQRLYKVKHGSTLTDGKSYTLEDITSRFWHKGIDPSAH